MRPNHVTVYGNDHSPWVQAVLLGLREAEIPSTLVTAPAPELLARGGVLMPAARFDDGPWRYDSGEILTALGYGAVEEARARALSNVFLRTSLTRLDERWAFWHRFSFSRDGDPRPLRRAWHHYARALPVFYFFFLISFGRRQIRPSEGDEIAALFAELQGQLAEEAPFFGGDAPDTYDFQLFGLVQMLETMPRLPLEVLCQHPTLDRLRRWIGAMQTRFTDYERLYTAQRFEPKSPKRPVATPIERALYWCGAATCWLAAPITVPLVVLLAARVRRKGLPTS